MRGSVCWAGLGAVVAIAALGCGQDADAPALPAFRHQALYERLQAEVGAFTRIDGDFKEDFGDGAFYGLAFAARAAATDGDAGLAALVDEVHDRNLRVITEQDLITGDTNEMAMATLGLIEQMAATGERADLPDVDAMIASVNGLVEAVGHYLTPEMAPGYSMDTYGPTSINGLMVILSLQRAVLLGGDDTPALVDFVEQVVERIDARAWNGTTYEMDDGVARPGLYLYPNITMLIVHARLWQLGAGEWHRERALAIYEGIAPLRVIASSGLAAPGRYRSPYSAEAMGAATDDYTTLSSQNYLILSLMLLYEITGEVHFVEEVDPIVDFLADDLHGSFCTSDFHRDPCDPACDGAQMCLEASCAPDSCGQATLHHWMDGAIARPEHLEFVCSGCNYQLLYLLWYRQNLAAAP